MEYVPNIWMAALEAPITVEAQYISENDTLAFYIKHNGNLIGYKILDDAQVALLVGHMIMARNDRTFKVCGFSIEAMTKYKNINEVGLSSKDGDYY